MPRFFSVKNLLTATAAVFVALNPEAAAAVVATESLRNNQARQNAPQSDAKSSGEFASSNSVEEAKKYYNKGFILATEFTQLPKNANIDKKNTIATKVLDNFKRAFELVSIDFHKKAYVASLVERGAIGEELCERVVDLNEKIKCHDRTVADYKAASEMVMHDKELHVGFYAVAVHNRAQVYLDFSVKDDNLHQQIIYLQLAIAGFKEAISIDSTNSLLSVNLAVAFNRIGVIYGKLLADTKLNIAAKASYIDSAFENLRVSCQHGPENQVHIDNFVTTAKRRGSFYTQLASLGHEKIFFQQKADESFKAAEEAMNSKKSIFGYVAAGVVVIGSVIAAIARKACGRNVVPNDNVAPPNPQPVAIQAANNGDQLKAENNDRKKKGGKNVRRPARERRERLKGQTQDSAPQLNQAAYGEKDENNGKDNKVDFVVPQREGDQQIEGGPPGPVSANVAAALQSQSRLQIAPGGPGEDPQPAPSGESAAAANTTAVSGNRYLFNNNASAVAAPDRDQKQEYRELPLAASASAAPSPKP